MSGGSFNYTYEKVDQEYPGAMGDVELDEMMKDLVTLLHDLEWWLSGDYREDQYRETVLVFKNKWFGKRDDNLRKILLDKLSKVQKEIGEL
jgi:hypothetical protein